MTPLETLQDPVGFHAGSELLQKTRKRCGLGPQNVIATSDDGPCPSPLGELQICSSSESLDLAVRRLEALLSQSDADRLRPIDTEACRLDAVAPDQQPLVS